MTVRAATVFCPVQSVADPGWSGTVRDGPGHAGTVHGAAAVQPGSDPCWLGVDPCSSVVVPCLVRAVDVLRPNFARIKISLDPGCSVFIRSASCWVRLRWDLGFTSSM